MSNCYTHRVATPEQLHDTMAENFQKRILVAHSFAYKSATELSPKEQLPSLEETLGKMKQKIAFKNILASEITYDDFKEGCFKDLDVEKLAKEFGDVDLDEYDFVDFQLNTLAEAKAEWTPGSECPYVLTRRSHRVFCRYLLGFSPGFDTRLAYNRIFREEGMRNE